MSTSIAVLGVGPGVGSAVARRWGKEGYDVALVARRPEPLEALAEELRDTGVAAYALPHDLADTAGVPDLVARIREAVGDPETVYYGASGDAFVDVLDLTVETVHDLMRIAVDTPITLVREILPTMLERGGGTILGTQGASVLRGNPHISGGLVAAAQRNYLQALHDQVRDAGVHVGGLWVGAAIEGTPFHSWLLDAQAKGEMLDFPVVHPDVLADELWAMQQERGEADRVYPAGIV